MQTSRILVTVAAMFILLAAVALEIDRQSRTTGQAARSQVRVAASR